MFDPLLKTKLHIPSPPAEVVARPRLLTMLDNGRRGKLSLVVAPAGFGKTTLVTEWLSQQNVPIGWVSLDEADNDPIRFLRYMRAAAQEAEPTIGQALVGMLQAPELPPVASLMTSLLNDLHERLLILVLDDYHLIEEPVIHELVGFFLTHQAAATHLIMTSRAEPPLPLSRLRARRRLTEITVADLRFGQEEAAVLLTDALGRELAEREVTQLAERTEGWAAGLHLAALSLRNQADVQGFIASFAGTDRYVLDYLLDEVFEQQPAEVQQFLLRTSVFERFSVELCDAIFGSETAAEMISTIGRNNLFLIPLDNEQDWFRYHHLFADLLRDRLQDQASKDIPGLYRNASRWFAAEKLIDEAIQYALLGEDYDHAAALIEETAILTLMRGGNPGMLSKQIEKLPAAVFETYPRLYTAQAWAILLMGQIDKVETLLKAAKNSAAYQEDADLRQVIDSTALNLQAIAARGALEVQKSIDLALEALRLLPEDSVQMRAILYLGLGSSYNMQGDLEASKRAASEVLELVEEVDSVFLKVQALLAWSAISNRELDLRQSAELYQQALTLLEEYQLTHTPTAALLYTSLGELAFDRYELEKAETYYQRALDLARPAGLIDAILTATANRARLLMYQYKFEEAKQLLHQLLNEIDQKLLSWVYDNIVLYLIEIQVRNGELDQVADWVAEQGFSVDRPDRLNVLDYLHWFTYELYRAADTGNNERLLPLAPFCARLIEQAHDQNLPQRLFLLKLHKSLLHKQLGEDEQAITCFQTALEMAAPQAYQSWFMAHQQWMVPLLQEAAKRGVEPQFVARLLTAWEQAPIDLPAAEATPSLSPNEALPEPLTERELEILTLIAQGLSTRQAAERLFLSAGTVKWHINNIYGKLDVSSRVNALNRAKALKLIP